MLLDVSLGMENSQKGLYDEYEIAMKLNKIKVQNLTQMNVLMV